MVAYDGLAEISSDRESRMFTDKDRELEMWLMQTSYERIDKDIYNRILINEFVSNLYDYITE